MLTPRQIHERLRDHIVASLSAPAIPGPWTESRHPWGAFLQLATGDDDHHSFAIGMPRFVPNPTDRQGTATAGVSTVSIRWAHRLKVDSVVADELEAYDAEQELWRVCRVTPIARLPLILAEANRSLAKGGRMVLGELLFDLPHLYPLS